MSERLMIFAAGAACGSLMTACICSVVIRRLTRTLAITTATMIVATSNVNANPIATPANEIRVIDGDTIAIGKTVYRLMGFDTPEIHHAKCAFEYRRGVEARDLLIGWLSGGTGHIIDSGKVDRYRRRLARLEIDGKDVKHRFIRLKLAYEYHGRGRRRNWCDAHG